MSGLTERPFSSTYLKSNFSLREALVRTDIALAAKCRVLYVSSKCMRLGLTQATIVVLQLPPRDSVSSLVSLESLNGTKLSGLLDASADTQFERAAIDLLMFLASYNLNPSDPVLLSLSEPARSTIVSNALR
jgi:hypothetical protein